MKKYLLFALIASNLLFGQINIFENFDSSNTTATGFSNGVINTNTSLSCSGNNSYGISTIPYVTQTFWYESPNTILNNIDLNLNFGYKYSLSGNGMTLTISYKLYNSNGNMYYEDTLPYIGANSVNGNCLNYSQVISKSKITQNNSSIKITFKFNVSNDSIYFSSIFLDNFKLLQTGNLSVNEIIKDQQIKIYPIPSNDKIFIENNENLNIINIYDNSGKLIINQKNINEKKIIINIESLPKGIYFLQTENVKRKFIKN